MITLGLDLSTKSSGWSLFDGQELKDYGCITAGSANLYKRIDKMVEEFDILLSNNKIDKVIIEEVINEDTHYNTTVFKALMYLQGFMMHLLDKHNITNVEFVVASAWRKKCGIRTGQGVRRESLKPKDIQFVQNQFGIKVNDDVADAICIAFSSVGGEIKSPQIITTESGFEFF